MRRVKKAAEEVRDKEKRQGYKLNRQRGITVISRRDVRILCCFLPKFGIVLLSLILFDSLSFPV